MSERTAILAALERLERAHVRGDFTVDELIATAQAIEQSLDVERTRKTIEEMCNAPALGNVYSDLLRVGPEGRICRAPDPFGTKMWYLEVALDYHIAVRHAVFNRLTAVAGNLAHHAVEMYMKGFLVPFLSEERRRSLGHRLKELWVEFKRHAVHADYAVLDVAVQRIDAFEQIRYPENMIYGGVSLQIARRRTQLVIDADVPQQPKFAFALEDVDRLAEVSIIASGADPIRLFSRLSPECQRLLLEDNATVVWQSLPGNDAVMS